MVSYAYLSIVKDWRRNMAIIVLLALSGLLLIYNTATLVDYMAESSQDILDLEAPLWLMPKGAGPGRGVLQAGIAERHVGERLVWLHENVAEVRPLITPRVMRIADPDNPFTFVRMTVVGLAPGDVTYPASFPAAFQELLKAPGAVIMRRSDADKLGLRVGAEFAVAEAEFAVMAQNTGAKPKSLILAGIINQRRGGVAPKIYVAPHTMRYLSPAGGGSGLFDSGVKAYAVNLKEPAAAAQTARELNLLLQSKGKKLVALTRAQMLENSKKLSTLQEAAGQRLQNLVVIVGGFVLIMTTLLMRSNFLSQIKEFGTLNALGVGKGRLAMLMMRQGCLMGIVACGLAGVAYVVLRAGLQPFNIFLNTTPQLFAVIMAVLVLIATLSSFLSVFVLRKIELTSLLR